MCACDEKHWGVVGHLVAVPGIALEPPRTLSRRSQRLGESGPPKVLCLARKGGDAEVVAALERLHIKRVAGPLILAMHMGVQRTVAIERAVRSLADNALRARAYEQIAREAQTPSAV